MDIRRSACGASAVLAFILSGVGEITMPNESGVELTLPNVWGPGQALRFSGLDGPTEWDTRFWGLTTEARYGFRLQTQPVVRILISAPGDLVCFTGDAFMTDGPSSSSMAYLDQQCLVGRCEQEATAEIEWEINGEFEPFPEAEVARLKRGTGAAGGSVYEEHVVLLRTRTAGGTRWALAYDRSSPEGARRRAEIGLLHDAAEVCGDRLESLRRVTFDFSRLSEDEARVALKAFAVLRGAFKAPEGQFTAPWCAPSPFHVHLNVWDTLFHGFGTRFIDPVLPEQEALMLLRAQRDDGFIGNPQRPPAPHHDARGIHPPLIGWALWNAYERRRNVATLEAAYPRLVRFIEWIRANKDSNGNLLLEWRHSDGCESGRDNDPRWDDRAPFDAVDFSGFLGSELIHLALIADELGKAEDAQHWRSEHARLRAAVKEVFWDEKEGFYFDRKLDGASLRVKTDASFVLLFGGLATEEHAERMVRVHLLNPAEFWTPMPVPSVAMTEAAYRLDMWRGPVWLCYNHLIADGLIRYGFNAEARELMERTVKGVVGWYRETGALWEFYDPMDAVEPAQLDRKGFLKGGGVRGIGGNVADYSWTAAGYVHFMDQLRGTPR